MHEIYLVELYPILAQLFVRGFPVCIGLEILQHAVLASAFGHPDGSAVGQFVFHESQSLLRSSSLCRRSSRNDGHIFSNRYDLSTTVPIARTDTQKDDNHNNQDNDKPYQPIVLFAVPSGNRRTAAAHAADSRSTAHLHRYLLYCRAALLTQPGHYGRHGEIVTDYLMAHIAGDNRCHPSRQPVGARCGDTAFGRHGIRIGLVFRPDQFVFEPLAEIHSSIYSVAGEYLRPSVEQLRIAGFANSLIDPCRLTLVHKPDQQRRQQYRHGRSHSLFILAKRSRGRFQHLRRDALFQ